MIPNKIHYCWFGGKELPKAYQDYMCSWKKNCPNYEIRRWDENNYDINEVKEELADVIVYCQDMLDKLGLDVDEIVNAKMDKNEAKYPVNKSKGKADKYNKL